MKRVHDQLNHELGASVGIANEVEALQDIFRQQPRNLGFGHGPAHVEGRCRVSLEKRPTIPIHRARFRSARQRFNQRGGPQLRGHGLLAGLKQIRAGKMQQIKETFVVTLMGCC